MAGVYQGFVVNRNLEENVIDRNALNNLGGTPIADDINLFKNNGRNVSSITVTEANINTVTDTISFTDRNVVFTNGTRVVFNDSAIYFVKNSNAENSFQLSTSSNLSTTVNLDASFAGVYSRSDEITFENITNYSKIRRPAIINSSQSVDGSGIYPFSTDVIERLDDLENYLSYYKNIRQKAILSNENFIFDENLRTEGHSLIFDPDGVNNSGLSKTAGPGLFIYDPNTSTRVRAFSDTQNVWTANPANTYLETTARKITTGIITIAATNLVIEYKPGSTTPLVNTISPAANITTAVFTHKAKTIINGEEFFLCLSNTA